MKPTVSPHAPMRANRDPNAEKWLPGEWRTDLPAENGSYLTVQVYHGIEVVDTAHFWRFNAKHARRGETEWTVEYGCEHAPHPQPVQVLRWMPMPDAKRGYRPDLANNLSLPRKPS